MADMINWITDRNPKAGEKVIIKLSDGRVFSGTVTESLGIDIDYVDSLDLMSEMVKGMPIQWYPNEDSIKE